MKGVRDLHTLEGASSLAHPFENLHRAELTPLERSEHIAEWVRLTDQESGATCATKPGAGRGSIGGVRAATRELGIDRTEAQRAVKIDGLTAEAEQAAIDAGLADNQSALLKAAKNTDAASSPHPQPITRHRPA